MIYLSGVSTPALRAELPRHDLGLMWTEKSFTASQNRPGCWAADNGCFSAAFNESRWLTWLGSRPISARAECLFAVAPDVVCDAAATAKRSASYFSTLANMGYRVAYVLQNGQESLPMPWDRIDAVFIGGDDTWKTGRHAAQLVYEAKARGKWAHMGRVNSERRMRRAAVMGCDSCDGTFLRFGEPVQQMARVTSWMSSLAHLPVLDLTS